MNKGTCVLVLCALLAVPMIASAQEEEAHKEVKMSETKTFYCLRCRHRFPAAYEPKQVAERSCPKCGSNSVRLETPAAAAYQKGD